VLYVKDKRLTDVFFRKNWPKLREEQRQVRNGEEDEEMQLGDLLDQLRGQGGASARYTLDNIDGCFSYQFKRGKEDPVWVRLCNFEMVELKTLYIFRDQKAGPPTQRVLVRRLVDPAGHGTMFVTPEGDGIIRNLTTEKYLEVEVLLTAQTYKTPDQVRSVFASAHGTLAADCLTPEMLNVWISGQIIEKGSALDTQMMVSYFGRQFDSETFVAGNCAVSLVEEYHLSGERETEFTVVKAQFQSLEDAGVAVMPKHFIDALVPMGVREFPRIMIIEQPWLRYAVFMNLWVNAMPDVFQNNEMSAKAVFAAGVMGLFAGKIWDGDHGIIGGMPFVWAYSPEHNTGKTTAANLVNAMLGLFRRGIWAGESPSPAAAHALKTNRIGSCTLCCCPCGPGSWLHSPWG
jgi:hypothetical protein